MTDTPPPLAELRREIDRIDEAMHRLLLERGDIIGRLIKAKRTAETGSAFRPAREAEMMRRLVARHSGILPLDTAESIWRVIIATFTYVQAPFRVHADFSAGEPAMRDCERFHFGFTVPLVGHMGPAGVVAAVASTPSDLGLVPIQASASGGAWWAALEADTAPKIIARLPFVEREDHPAGLPVFAIARPHPDAVVTDVAMWSLRVAGWARGRPRRWRALPRPWWCPTAGSTVPRCWSRSRRAKALTIFYRCWSGPASRYAGGLSSAATRSAIWSGPIWARHRPAGKRRDDPAPHLTLIRLFRNR